MTRFGTLKLILTATALSLSISLSLAWPAPRAAAVSGYEFKAGRIIDDVIFKNAGSMSISQIQDFLNAKVPSCDNWGTQPYAGTTRRAYSEARGVTFPLTCLKDYYENPVTRENNLEGRGIPGGGKSAAHLIYDAAQLYNVNPQVLIVLLQKEQNLVLDDWPWPKQFTKATGFACPDTAACDSQYAGFWNQLKSAANQFQRYATNPQSFNHIAGTINNVRFHPNAACGTSQVFIENQATASLYNYTPYQPNAAALSNMYGLNGDGCSSYGNRNFFRYFNDWFGTTYVGQYPSPLYKSLTSDLIYALAEGKKYPIPSYGVMVNYGLQRYPVALVESSFLDNYTTGPALTSIAKKSQDPSGTLYLFDDGKRYPISIGDCKQNPDGSTIANTTWGLDCFNTAASLSLPNIFIDRYTSQDINLPQVILYDNAAWKLEQGKKRRITSTVFVDVLGGWGRARWMKDINASQPVGKMLVLDDSVIKFSGDGTMYLVRDSGLKPVSSMQQYNAWNLFKLPGSEYPGGYNSDPLPVGSALQFCAQTASGEYFMLTLDKTRFSLNGQQSNWNLSSCTTNQDLTLLITPRVANTGLYRSEDGAVFTVYAQQKFPFATLNDFSGLGFHTEHIINLPNTLTNTLTYGGMSLASGRLYKVSGSATIYRVQGSTSQIVNSTNYPGLPYDKLITVDNDTAARYPVSGTYQP